MAASSQLSLSSLRTLVWLLLVSVLALLWAGVFWLKHASETAAIERAQIQTGDLALAFAEHTRTTFTKLDFALNELRASVASGREPVALSLNQISRRIGDALIQISIVDGKGRVSYSSLGTVQPALDVSDREHVKVHLHGGEDRLFVSRPVKGRVSGKWSLQLTRPMLRHGRNNGVMIFSVDPGYFVRFYERLKLGRQGLVVMVRDSGEIMARSIDMESHIAKVVSTSPYGDPGAPPTGHYRRLSQADGIDRITSYHRLPEFGLTVIIGAGVDDIMAPARQQHRQLSAAAMLVSLVLLALSGLLLRGLAERRRQEEALRASEAGYRAVFDNAAAGIARASVSGQFLQINDKYCEIIGYSREEVLSGALSFQQITPPGDLEKNLALTKQALDGGIDRYSLEKRYRRKDGSMVWVMLSSHLLRDDQGVPQYFIAAAQDITERKQAEEQLQLAATVFASSYEGIMITDAANLIVDVNPAFSRITGFSREEVLGKSPGVLSSGRQGQAFYRDMWDALAKCGQWHGEVWNRRKSGEVYAEMLAISLVRDGDGQPRHYIAVFSDISQIKAHEAELNRIAHFDTLTGVPNRRLLADRLNQAIARSHRSGKLLAVCYLDLDGFKPVNDIYGHAAGDQLLIEITNRLRTVLRADDTLARLGGDEFVLLFVNLAQAAECERVLDRVLAVVGEPVIINQAPVAVSASIGVALYPTDDADADTLLRHADQAMYRAKELGKNRYHLFDAEQDRQLKDHRERLLRMQRALDDGEFELHYQPKVDLVSGAVIGAEALIRWNHPERGLVMPGAFLDYLAGTEQEIAVGEWVIDSVLAQIAAWNALGLRLVVSANVSAEHLLHAEFSDRLRAALARHPEVAAAEFELEILETTALGDMDRAVAVLKECLGFGVRFALDDFGTGYSSLAYFRSLPVNILKIDQSFVRDMLVDAGDLGIVESVVKLAQAFNRPVIAEGVETLAHGAALVSLGCRLGQGYGIARPMPAGRFPQWLDEWRERQAWLELAHLAGPSGT